MKTLLAIILLLFNCQFYSDTKNDSFQLFGLFTRLSKVTITGKAIKGPYKNARLQIFPMNNEGKCNMSQLLASDFTDSSGDYSLSFNRTDGLVCVMVDASPQGNTTLYDEKTKKDLYVTSENNLVLLNVIPESILQTRKANLGVTPISKMLLTRMESLSQGNADPLALERAYRTASREMVIRFNLNRGLNSRAISDEGVPTLEELNIDWNNIQNPNTLQMFTILAGFSELSNQFKKGSEVNPSDVENLLKVFASDASDGKFDGKQSGTSLFLPNGEEMGENPLTNRLRKAIQKFIAEGGKIGIDANTNVVIPPETLTTILSFQDSIPIISSGSNPITSTEPVSTVSLLNFGSGFSNVSELDGTVSIPVFLSSPSTSTVSVNYSVTGGTATQGVDYSLNNGTLSFSPGQLTQSISIALINDSTTEQIETIQISLSSPVSANLGTLTTHTVNIVDDETPDVQYPVTKYVLVVGQSLSIIPTVTGNLTSCTGEMPEGISIQPNCALSGTALSTVGATNYTVNAANGANLQPITLNIQVLENKEYTNSVKYYLSNPNQSCESRCQYLGGVGSDLVSTATSSTACKAALEALLLPIVPTTGSAWSGHYPCMYAGGTFLYSTLGFSPGFGHPAFNMVCPCIN